VSTFRFSSRFKPGVHFEEFKYDASDLLEKAERLINMHKQGSKALSEMAARASLEALHTFHMYAQLDAVMYAVIKVSNFIVPPMWSIDVTATTCAHAFHYRYRYRLQNSVVQKPGCLPRFWLPAALV
jgi:hypothetical protein